MVATHETTSATTRFWSAGPSGDPNPRIIRFDPISVEDVGKTVWRIVGCRPANAQFQEGLVCHLPGVQQVGVITKSLRSGFDLDTEHVEEWFRSKDEAYKHSRAKMEHGIFRQALVSECH